MNVARRKIRTDQDFKDLFIRLIVLVLFQHEEVQVVAEQKSLQRDAVCE